MSIFFVTFYILKIRTWLKIKIFIKIFLYIFDVKKCHDIVIGGKEPERKTMSTLIKILLIAIIAVVCHPQVHAMGDFPSPFTCLEKTVYDKDGQIIGEKEERMVSRKTKNPVCVKASMSDEVSSLFWVVDDRGISEQCIHDFFKKKDSEPRCLIGVGRKHEDKWSMFLLSATRIRTYTHLEIKDDRIITIGTTLEEKDLVRSLDTLILFEAYVLIFVFAFGGKTPKYAYASYSFGLVLYVLMEIGLFHDNLYGAMIPLMFVFYSTPLCFSSDGKNSEIGRM